jgi:hypothetical protein
VGVPANSGIAQGPTNSTRLGYRQQSAMAPTTDKIIIDPSVKDFMLSVQELH